MKVRRRRVEADIADVLEEGGYKIAFDTGSERLTLEDMFAHMTPRSRKYFLDELKDRAVVETLTPNVSQWCPHTPNPGPQTRFCDLYDTREILYGGAAGGGKTEALLIDALRYVHIPGYSAIIFRRTFPQLSGADNVIERSLQWFKGTRAKWNSKHSIWTFPSGATLRFAHMQYEQDKYDHHGSAYQFVGFDELTHFTEGQYTYMFSRQRAPEEGPLSTVPLRMRAASNPGGIGHAWVKRRFITHNDKAPFRLFIGATLNDNPKLNRAQYIDSMSNLDEVTKAQLLGGDWDTEGNVLLTAGLITDAVSASCLWPMGQRPARTRSSELYLGFDIGRTSDRSVITTLERMRERLYTREVFIMHKVKFAMQLEELQKRMIRDVVMCTIDKGGIGMQLAETMEDLYPGRVIGVQLTDGRQGQLAAALKTLFESAQIEIPDDPVLHQDFQLVRNLGIKNGLPIIQTNKDETGHADRFWSMALARHGVPLNPIKRLHTTPRGVATRTSST